MKRDVRDNMAVYLMRMRYEEIQPTWHPFSHVMEPQGNCSINTHPEIVVHG